MAFTHVYRAIEMPPLTVVPYKPKLQIPFNCNDHNLPSKPFVREPSSLDASLRIDFGESSAETVPESSWLAKNDENCDTAARNAIGPSDDPKSSQGPTKDANVLAAMNDPDDDSDDEFPSIRRLLSPEYRHKLVEEGLLVQDRTADVNIDEALQDLVSYGLTAGSSLDKPIVVDSESRLEDRDDDLDHTRTLRTLDSEPLCHDALNLDILHSPFKRLADKIEDGDNDNGKNGMNSNVSRSVAKRQRPSSPRCEPDLRHTSTPSFPQHEDVESNAEKAAVGDADEPGEDDFLWKGPKHSDILGSSTTLSSHSRQPPNSFPPASEDPEGDGADVSESEDNLASTARTTPDISEAPCLTKPQLYPEVAEPGREWEVRKVIGKEYVEGVLHYMVEWCPTLEPANDLEHAKEAVDEFEAFRKDSEGQRKLGVKRDGQKAIGHEVATGQQKKRWRGRKQK